MITLTDMIYSRVGKYMSLKIDNVQRKAAGRMHFIILYNNLNIFIIVITYNCIEFLLVF